MARSDKYVEDLTIALFKVDNEGLFDAVNEGYFNFEDFYDEDVELAEALATFHAAGRSLEGLIEVRRTEYEIEIS